MAVFSPLTSRRVKTNKAGSSQQLIVFRLYNEGFALPIRAVQKVIPLSHIYGGSLGAGVGLTLYQDQELLIINVGHRIFKGVPSQDLEKRDLHPQGQEEQQDITLAHFLLIVQNSQEKLVGLPIDSPPSLQRVPESAFTPLTSTYMAEGSIRCVSALVIQNNDEPPLFLLNPEKLVGSQPVLPGTTEF